jgi:hypothetical protein
VRKAKVVIGEFQFVEPAFRTNSRIVAVKDDDGYVQFGLEYQSDDEPGVWLPEVSFSWHALNFDAIICAAAEFNDEIQKIIRYREKQAREEQQDV